MVFKKALVAAATLSLVQFTSAWHVEMPPCIDEFKPFVYSGCYQDAKPGALIYRSSAPVQGMTPEKCIAECKGNGFRYAGLKYYGACYCGATVNGGELEESKCNLKCDGDKNQACGGNDAFSVWQDPTFEADTTKVTINNYVPLGCYTDDDSTPGPTLSWPQKMDTATFTPEKCLASCKAQGFPLAGTEYGQECWCGSVLANNTVPAPASECNMKCKGDATQLCGGRNRLNIYVAKELQSLQPCGYKPPVSSSSTVSVPESTSSEYEQPPSSTSESEEPETTTSEELPETTTSEELPETTASEELPETTTSEELPETTTSKSEQPPVTSSTSASVSVPPSTTQPPVKSSTTSAALCTSTVTKPSECEYKCGNWCAPSIPDWENKEDCIGAFKTCSANMASCFKKAGWPGVLNCFDFGTWCKGIEEFCYSSPCKSKGSCNKKTCFDKYKPVAPKPPVVSTTVYPCPASTTKATSTKPSVPITCAPEPTNVCKQPQNKQHGYAPGKPVGGIELPLVGCNDFLDSWKSSPFKLYTDENTRKCKTYTRPQCGNACTEACKEQYDQCKNVYVESCKKFGWKSYFHRREAEAELSDVEKRFFGSFNKGAFFGGQKDTYNVATNKCAAQYKDCVAVNKNINPGNRCTTWGKGY
jgi:hypothetical protein